MDQESVKKGSAETLVLALLDERPLHGYGLAKKIEERSRGVLQFHVTSLYPTLYRLEQEGLVQGSWEAKTSGRRRRVYRLTAAGREVLEEQRSSWRSFMQAFSHVAGIEHA